MTTANTDMEFRLLREEESELAEALAASVAGIVDERFEGWGVDGAGRAPSGCRTWGIFISECLVGACWIALAEAGAAEIKAFALPRGRWGMGLVPWCVERLEKTLGVAAFTVTLPVLGVRMGEILEDAGFSGPALGETGYPAGRWLRGPVPASHTNRLGMRSGDSGGL